MVEQCQRTSLIALADQHLCLQLHSQRGEGRILSDQRIEPRKQARWLSAIELRVGAEQRRSLGVGIPAPGFSQRLKRSRSCFRVPGARLDLGQLEPGNDGITTAAAGDQRLQLRAGGFSVGLGKRQRAAELSGLRRAHRSLTILPEVPGRDDEQHHHDHQKEHPSVSADARKKGIAAHFLVDIANNISH